MAQERLVARLALPKVPLEPLAGFSAKRKSSESFSVSLRNADYASRRRRVAKLRFRQSTAADFGE
jgi:hypothetical protein